MTPEEEKSKKNDFEEQLFKKKWAKHLKLSPVLCKISKNVGKAPKCNIKEPKKDTAIIVDSKSKNNKKKR